MQEIWSDLEVINSASVVNIARYPSCFAVSDLAAESLSAVGCAIAQLCTEINLSSSTPTVTVDQRLASFWFAQSLLPVDWELPPVWDAIAGDYRAKDGWIKLHTNLPHHRAAARKALSEEGDRAAVEAAVATWSKDDLEAAIVANGGVAAAMRSHEEWQAHPQGQAVSTEPLITWSSFRSGTVSSAWQPSRERPLNGLKVLDLTRVLAGPVATRTLAGFGAQVLRIDPPGWDEANVVPDITLGKRCTYLSIDQPDGRQTFTDLLAEADVLVHGYRPGALAGLGFDVAQRQAISPNLLEVSLDAYGHTGPWSMRRGFDSLVQMSCGIADAGMRWRARDKPTPLPVQALDHATGYLLAASLIRALTNAAASKQLRNAQLSLARTAVLLMNHRQTDEGKLHYKPAGDDFSADTEITPWGQSRRLRPAIAVEGAPMSWPSPATSLGTSPPTWHS